MSRVLPIVLATCALCVLAACTSTPPTPTLDEWPHITLSELAEAQGDSVTLGGPGHAPALAVRLDEDSTVRTFTVGGRPEAEGGPYFLDLQGHTLTVDGNFDVQPGYALVLRRGGEVRVNGDVTIAQGGSIVQEWTKGGTVQTVLTITGDFTNQGHIDLPGAIRSQPPAGED